MSKIETGGPAFPESYVGTDMPHEGIGNGMTMRDYFAAKAMNGLLANPVDSLTYEDDSVAESAYKMADAMLAARSKA